MFPSPGYQAVSRVCPKATGCVKQKPRCCHLLLKDSALHNLTLEPYHLGALDIAELNCKAEAEPN